MSSKINNSNTPGPVNLYQTGGKRAYVILILLCLCYLFDYTDRMIVASLFPFIKKTWAVNDMQLGSLQTVVSIFMAIMVLPLSLVVDRWSRRKMVSLMVLFWSLATIACAFANNFEQLLVARAFTGLGEAGYAPAAVAIIAASFPQESRAKMTGIWDAFAPVGAGVGFLVGGYVGMHYGWQHAFGLVGIPGILLAIAFWFTHDYKTVSLTDEKNKADSISSIDTKGLWSNVAGLFKIPSLWFVYLAFAMNMAVSTPIMLWLPTYLNRFHGMNEQVASTATGGIALLVLVGAPLGGYLADRWLSVRQDSRMIMSGITSLISAAMLVCAFMFPQSGSFWVFILLFGIFSLAFLAPGAAAIQDVVHPGLRALAYGICVVCQHLLGNSWSPMLIGDISDHVGLEKALLITPVFGFIAAILFFAGAKWYSRDIGRVSRVVLYSE